MDVSLVLSQEQDIAEVASELRLINKKLAILCGLLGRFRKANLLTIKEV